MTLANDTLLRALRREPTPHVPVWLMRQAGRYLPEYAALRARAGSFLALATTPSLATEATLQPLARFPLDAAILFSDILTVPDAMGLGLSFAEGEGPRFARTVADERAIAALAVPDPARLRYVFDAIAQVKRALADRVPLIGFAGSPFTLACYMIEGRASSDFANVRRMAFARPDLLDRLVATNAKAVAGYLREQVTAGADALMLFDTWGGLLSPSAYRRFSLDPMRTILAQMPTARAHDRVLQRRRLVACRDRRIRCVVRGPRLDNGSRRRACALRRARRIAGQPRPACVADGSGYRSARRHRPRSSGRYGTRVHFQPRPWDRSGDASGECGRAGRGGSRGVERGVAAARSARAGERIAGEPRYALIFRGLTNAGMWSSQSLMHTNHPFVLRRPT